MFFDKSENFTNVQCTRFGAHVRGPLKMSRFTMLNDILNDDIDFLNV